MAGSRCGPPRGCKSTHAAPLASRQGTREPATGEMPCGQARRRVFREPQPIHPNDQRIAPGSQPLRRCRRPIAGGDQIPVHEPLPDHRSHDVPDLVGRV